MQTTRLPTFYMTRFYNMHTLLFAIQMMDRVIIWAPVPVVFFSIIFFLIYSRSLLFNRFDSSH